MTDETQTVAHAIELSIGATTKRSRFAPLPVNVDWNALPDASQAFVIRYGLKQYLADAMAGCESEAEAHNEVKARVAKLLSGDLSRARGEGLSRPDTLETRTNKLARAFLVAALKEANAKATKEQMVEAVAELVKTDGSFAKEAKKQLDQETAMKEGKSDAANTVLSGILAKVKAAQPAPETT